MRLGETSLDAALNPLVISMAMNEPPKLPFPRLSHLPFAFMQGITF